MPKQWRLTKTRLGLKGGKFVHLTGKAWHCKVVLAFLVDYLETQDVDPMLKTACWSAQKFSWSAFRQQARINFLAAARNSTGPDDRDAFSGLLSPFAIEV